MARVKYDNYPIIELGTITAGVVVLGAGFSNIFGSALSHLDISTYNLLFGNYNWKLIGETTLSNIADARVVQNKFGFSRLLASLSLSYSSTTTYTNSSGGARNVFVRRVITPTDIITATAYAKTENLIVAWYIGGESGANITTYGPRLYVVHKDYPIESLSAVGVG
ncbi:hypothetical protein M0R19_03150 [Candidatus Pacearchaeota archaeon]|jgi:hypothetical protein|nr:hypothetical protein [Candidatus Pacearchaeota archaeon]